MKSIDELGISPAPWTHEEAGMGFRWIMSHEHEYVASTTCGQTEDAWLIAAAPDLYEALERVRSALAAIREKEREGADVLNKGFILDELVRIATSALAKAGGAE